MERDAMANLIAWKDAPRRKPLVVNGARQVGKTWLVTEFGRRHFDATAHLVFMENEEAQRAFSSSFDPQQLLMLVGALTGTNPRDGKTLVFLDEIQECPRAIAALKLFAEQAPDIPVVAAGSLLGLALNRDGEGGSGARAPSWPVGKVSYLDLHPMTFDEFARAAGKEQLAELLDEGDWNTIALVGEQLEALLRQYLYVGGMPEAVQAYASTGDLAEARRVHSELLRGYEMDFSKHAGGALATERIRATWHSVPSQLATQSDMKRFTYASIKDGARGRDYRDAVSWLQDAGLVTRVRRVSKPGIPLDGYADETYFKLYLLDVGLLGAATRLGASSLIGGSPLFTEYRGAYAEQYVCQQMLAYSGIAPCYWSADGKHAKGEVDFIMEHRGAVVPVEVKAAGNVAGGSLARFCKDFSVEKAVRFSLLGYADQGWLENVPLYALKRYLASGGGSAKA